VGVEGKVEGKVGRVACTGDIRREWRERWRAKWGGLLARGI
jgi:hypothetical protein